MSAARGLPSAPGRPARAWQARLARWLGAGLLAALPIALVAIVPDSVGASWESVFSAIGAVSWEWLAALSLIWLTGLIAHTVVLTASMPGLKAKSALGLNLAGSAVGNVVPLGGSMSVALTTAMAASWGFSAISLGAFLTISTLWNVLIRLLAGLLGLGWLVFAYPSAVTAAHLGSAVGWAVGLAGLALALSITALARDRMAAHLGGLVGALIDRWRTARGRDPSNRRHGIAVEALRIRRRVTQLVGASWPQLSSGMVAYLLSLCLLLALCLRALSAPQSLSLVAACVGIERLITAIPLTPGGSGVAEVALVACLIAGGTPAVSAVAACLLYRIFTFFIEIPLGLAVAVGWGVSRRRGQAQRATRM